MRPVEELNETPAGMEISTVHEVAGPPIFVGDSEVKGTPACPDSEFGEYEMSGAGNVARISIFTVALSLPAELVAVI